MKDYAELIKAKKIAAVITDLDNTLWKGTLAEKEPLSLNQAYYDCLIGLWEKGIQVFILSKNDAPDVLETFKKMKINPEFFTRIISNWDPKYLNIERLIEQTNLRPETAIFIDDNPLERTEAKSKIPKLLLLDSKDWQALQRIEAIQKKETQPESEIKERINRYRTAIVSAELKEKFTEPKEFLRSLKREISIGEISAENLDRFTRLLVTTHRINFNPEKFQEYDKTLDYLHERAKEGFKLYAISARENGISLGIIGALVVQIEKNKATVPDGVFSCGAIGRDFEQKSVLALADILKKQGVKELEFNISLTSTNKRVREIFEELGFSLQSKHSARTVYRANLLELKPGKTYDWIKINSKPPEMEQIGISSVKKFFNERVKPLFEKNSSVISLGAAKGEVLGQLNYKERQDFYHFLKENRTQYLKVDLEYIPEEKNIVGDAEDLKEIVKSQSYDLVMAIELLEHTEHFWKVINEAIRICKTGGHIFISVPSFNYPKHEYPIDLWRIGPKTLSAFFPEPEFGIVALETEGNKENPRRTMILAKKLKQYSKQYEMPEGGKTDWNTGITVFP